MQGKTAIVTGGDKGVGEAAVRRLVAAGANVVIADVDAEAGDALAEAWDFARFQGTLDVNLIGVFNGIEAVAPAMKRGGGGSTVNIGSVVAFQGLPRPAGYVASKWTVCGLAKAAAFELGAHGIRVNAVHPGQIQTPLTEGVVFNVDNIALGRVGQPDDIARLVVFLASDDAAFITGADLLGDGRQFAGPADYSAVPSASAASADPVSDLQIERSFQEVSQ